MKILNSKDLYKFILSFLNLELNFKFKNKEKIDMKNRAKALKVPTKLNRPLEPPTILKNKLNIENIIIDRETIHIIVFRKYFIYKYVSSITPKPTIFIVGN